MTITLTDHAVPHISTVPANKGQYVELFVRERNGTPLGAGSRRAVLMLHGRSIPALAGFDLQYKTYGWADALAEAGYDVFVMDLQGSGRSPRPRMEDPCNVNPALHESLLKPNPLAGKRTPSYPFQLNNAQSDWDELNTVVEYILQLRGVEAGISFIGWSAAAFTMGPYAAKHADVVRDLFLLAPMFPPAGRTDPPTPLPAPGFPTNLLTRKGLVDTWDKETLCDGQRESAMVDVVWDALMDNDPIGRTWGNPPAYPEGVNRFRNALWWGWNKATVGSSLLGSGSGPQVCIVYGEHDLTANSTNSDPLLTFSVPALYEAIPGSGKMLIKVACAGHSMPWERQHTNLHKLSKRWLKNQIFGGVGMGVYTMDEQGALTRVP